MSSVNCQESDSMNVKPTTVAKMRITERMVPCEISRWIRPMSATARVIMSPIV